MKLYKKILLVTLMSIILTACTVDENNNNKSSIQDISASLAQRISEAKQSQKFSSEDIDDACRVVEQTMADEFFGCHLESLTYDADRTEKFDADKQGREFGREVGDIMVLFSVFTTDSSLKPGVNSTMYPNSTYKWYWFLERDEESGEWVVNDYGWD